MRTKIKELKRIARGNLQGHFLTFIRVYVFCTLITSLLEMPFSLMTNEVHFSTQNIIYYIATILIGIASVVLTAGQYRLHLRLARSGEMHLSEVFMPLRFHSNQFIFTEMILFGISLFTLLPMFGGIYLIYTGDSIQNYATALAASIISFVLGMYISLTFDLVYFVMIDNENLSMIQALKYTKNMIYTHRKRYLYMQLSFLGMLLLCGLSFGLAFLWVQPYMIHTTTLFYLDVKGELPEVLENRKHNDSIPEPTIINEYV
ncbi:MAG: DUF975 family protein [Agathobacter sp.]|nr:DUF975 family protein [Agathobacter sp.]